MKISQICNAFFPTQVLVNRHFLGCVNFFDSLNLGNHLSAQPCTLGCCFRARRQEADNRFRLIRGKNSFSERGPTRGIWRKSLSRNWADEGRMKWRRVSPDKPRQTAPLLNEADKDPRELSTKFSGIWISSPCHHLAHHQCGIFSGMIQGSAREEARALWKYRGFESNED